MTLLAALCQMLRKQQQLQSPRSDALGYKHVWATHFDAKVLRAARACVTARMRLESQAQTKALKAAREKGGAGLRASDPVKLEAQSKIVSAAAGPDSRANPALSAEPEVLLVSCVALLLAKQTDHSLQDQHYNLRVGLYQCLEVPY